MAMITLPEGLSKLTELESKYKGSPWKEIPLEDKNKILEIAFANGGFGWFYKDDYRDHIVDLANQLASADEEYEEERKQAKKMLRHFAKIVYESYKPPPSLLNKQATENKLANIYIRVEEYRAQNTKASIREATRVVAKELGLKTTYIHRKYYDMKEKLKAISLEEVKRQFEAAKGSSKDVSKPRFPYKNIGHRD